MIFRWISIRPPDARAMTSIVMLAALDVEYRAIRRHLDRVRLRVHPAGTVFEVGLLPDVDGTVVLAVTGEGNVAAAVVAERAIAMFRPSALFCVGVAGGLAHDVALGDVVVATRVYAVGGGREHAGGFAVRPRAFSAAHELEQVARHVARRGAWCTGLASTPAVHFKPVASGEVVHQATGTEYARRLRDAYDDAVAVEMESAGVAQAAQLNRALPALTVRAISDRADCHKALADAAGWQPVAAERAAAFATAVGAALFSPVDDRVPAHPVPAVASLHGGRPRPA
jgi:adenosylhomocysteine nucleosidase